MADKKTIMILGGGYYNLPLIKKAVELGYFTIVCGISGDYPGYKVANLWLDVDTFDCQAILKVAKQYRIDAIYATGADTIMPTIGYINEQLHLIGPTTDSIFASTNKSEMKKRFIAHGVRTGCISANFFS